MTLISIHGTGLCYLAGTKGRIAVISFEKEEADVKTSILLESSAQNLTLSQDGSLLCVRTESKIHVL